MAKVISVRPPLLRSDYWWLWMNSRTWIIYSYLCVSIMEGKRQHTPQFHCKIFTSLSKNYGMPYLSDLIQIALWCVKSISSNDIYVEVVGSLLNMVNNRKIGMESPVCSTNRPWNPWWSSQALSINWAMHCNLLPPKVVFRHKKSWVLKMKCMIDLLVDKQII